MFSWQRPEGVSGVDHSIGGHVRIREGTCWGAQGPLHRWAVLAEEAGPRATSRERGFLRAAFVLIPPWLRGTMLPPSTWIGVLSVTFACNHT